MPKTQPKILALAVLCALALPGAAWADCPWGGSVAGYLGCEFDELQGLLLDVEESLSAEVGLVQDSRHAVSSCEPGRGHAVPATEPTHDLVQGVGPSHGR